MMSLFVINLYTCKVNDKFTRHRNWHSIRAVSFATNLEVTCLSQRTYTAMVEPYLVCFSCLLVAPDACNKLLKFSHFLPNTNLY